MILAIGRRVPSVVVIVARGQHRGENAFRYVAEAQLVGGLGRAVVVRPTIYGG